LTECLHTTIIKDLCADCGADLEQIDVASGSKASVPMIHSVPELKVSESLAKKLGRADTDRLLADRKLVLLVDLDQTLIHTTNDNVPNNLKVSSRKFKIQKINFKFCSRTFTTFNFTVPVHLGTTPDFVLVHSPSSKISIPSSNFTFALLAPETMLT
jgi:hypothetical protein